MSDSKVSLSVGNCETGFWFGMEILLTARSEGPPSSAVSFSPRTSLPPPVLFSFSSPGRGCGCGVALSSSGSPGQVRFPVCFAPGTLLPFVYVNGFWVTVGVAMVTTLPAVVVPFGLGSFVTTRPGGVYSRAMIVGIGDPASIRA